MELFQKDGSFNPAVGSREGIFVVDRRPGMALVQMFSERGMELVLGDLDAPEFSRVQNLDFDDLPKPPFAVAFADGGRYFGVPGQELYDVSGAEVTLESIFHDVPDHYCEMVWSAKVLEALASVKSASLRVIPHALITPLHLRAAAESAPHSLAAVPDFLLNESLKLTAIRNSPTALFDFYPTRWFPKLVQAAVYLNETVMERLPANWKTPEVQQAHDRGVAARAAEEARRLESRRDFNESLARIRAKAAACSVGEAPSGDTSGVRFG